MATDPRRHLARFTMSRVAAGASAASVALVAMLAMPTSLASAPPEARFQDKPRLSSWKLLRAGDIEGIGDVSDATLRRAVAEISSFRSAFAGLYPRWRVNAPVPTRVVVFPRIEAFQRFSPRDDRGRPTANVAGYFEPGPDANVLAIGANVSHVVFHEFAHYLLNRNFHSLPLWLQEGLADFYSTFESDRQTGKSLIGRAPTARLQNLRGRSALLLRQSVFATPEQMRQFWHDRARIDLFYSTSWALVHFLMLGRDAQALSGFVTAVESGTPHERAFADAFGDADRLEDELRRYLRQFRLPAIAFAAPTADEASLPIVRLTEADARAVQGELLLSAGANEDAEREFGAALKLEGANVAAGIGNARAVAARADFPGAISALERIVAAHPKSFPAAYHLAAVLSDAGRHEDAAAAYRRAMLLNPASPDVWFGQSISAMALGLDTQAEAAMKQALLLQPGPDWYRRRAYAALRYRIDATAAADVRRYIELGGLESSSSPYTAFVAAIAYWRLGQQDEATKILDEVRPVIPTQSWTGTVLDFMRGGIPAEKFLARAKTLGERTEAHTYVGFKDAIAGRRDEALAHFRWVRDQGAKNYREYELAVGELYRLERQ